MMLHKILVSILAVGPACLFAEPAVGQKPLLHFDASDGATITSGVDGVVEEWRSKCGRARLRPADPGARSGPVVSTNESQPAVCLKEGGSALALETEAPLDLPLATSQIFVVARTPAPDSEGSLLALDPDLKIYCDGKNYRLRAGAVANQNPEGPPADDLIHLFEFTHRIDSATKKMTSRTAWPGDFIVDGQLCGKVFTKEREVPLEDLRVGANAGEARAAFPSEISEIIIYDEELDHAALDKIRIELASKWRVELHTWAIPDGLPVLPETRIGPPEQHSAFGYFGTSPESPDGTRIAYIVYPGPPGQEEGDLFPMDLWVSDSSLENPRLVARGIEKLTGGGDATLHNGAMVQWVDNRRVVVGGGRRGNVCVVDVDTGDVELGPYTRAWPSGVPHNGQIVLHTVHGSNVGPPGLYRLDTSTGSVVKLLTAEDCLELMDTHGWVGSRETKTWRFTHSKFSPDGKKLAFAAVPGGGGQQLCIAKADGSEPKVFGRFEDNRGSDKPLHWHWYDSEHLIGVDQDTRDGSPNNLFIKIWDLEGNMVRAVAGPGNHIAISPDRQWILGESFYYENPTRLYVYRSGETKPAAVVFEEDGMLPTWILNGHVNPSFSRDGRKIYYNRPVNGRYSQAFRADLEPLLKPDTARATDRQIAP